MEVLKVLRQILEREDSIQQRNCAGEVWYRLGKQWVSGSSSTVFRIDKKEGCTYSLSTVWFFWEWHLQPHNVYVKAATGKGIIAVTKRDRTSLIRYLNGAGELDEDSVETNQIVVDARNTPPMVKVDVNNPNESLDLEVANIPENFAMWRKKRVENKAKKQQQHMIEYLDLTEERVWTDRNTILNAKGNTDFGFLIERWIKFKKRKVEEEQQVTVASEVERIGTKGYSRYDQELFDAPGLDFQHNSFQNNFDYEAIKTGTIIGHEERPENRSTSGEVRRSVQKRSTLFGNGIIIVPPDTPASIFCLRNCLSLLEASSFNEDRKDCMNNNNNNNNNNKYLKLSRHIKEEKREYLVVDDVKNFTEAEWASVVAIFVMGAEWQFKDFKIKRTTDIFAKYPSFHVYYDDQPVHKNVQKWNVHPIGLNKTRRHLDVPKMMEFWKKVDLHVLKTAVEKKRCF